MSSMGSRWTLPITVTELPVCCWHPHLRAKSGRQFRLHLAVPRNCHYIDAGIKGHALKHQDSVRCWWRGEGDSALEKAVDSVVRKREVFIDVGVPKALSMQRQSRTHPP
jgi:hypothetical protein